MRYPKYLPFLCIFATLNLCYMLVRLRDALETGEAIPFRAIMFIATIIPYGLVLYWSYLQGKNEPE